MPKNSLKIKDVIGTLQGLANIVNNAPAGKFPAKFKEKIMQANILMTIAYDKIKEAHEFIDEAGKAKE